MKIILVLLLAAAAVWLIVPILKLSALLFLGVVLLSGLLYSCVVFFPAVRENINPYRTYHDRSKNAPQGVRRNYFFGPGFHQLRMIIVSAFRNLMDSRDERQDWLDRHTVTDHLAVRILLYIVYYATSVCIVLACAFWCLLLSVLMTAVLLTGMTVFFLLFSAVFLADALPLLVKSVQSRCPSCKYRCLIPVYRCPVCNLPHRRLISGPYGVLHRRCSCGAKLAVTFIGGRSHYRAECARCGEELAGTGSRQFGIQLIGGIGAGKTTYLSAFWHEYREWIKSQQGVVCEPFPADAFRILEELFQAGVSQSTLETNANMYSIMHRMTGHVPVQLAVYDIAGEVFDYSEPDVRQLQFSYCEGFVLVLDPTVPGSEMSQVISRFILGMEQIGSQRASAVKKTPVAVIITKSDLFQQEIGPAVIRARWNAAVQNAEDVTCEQVRDRICRDFLMEKDCLNAVNLIESKFSSVGYFPVSAMGHEAGKGTFAPWGVLAPVFWLMRRKSCPLRTLLPPEHL